MNNRNMAYILITAIVCLAVLTSGCTININTDSDDKQTTNEEKQTVTDTEQTTTNTEQTEVTTKRTQAPQASLRYGGNTLQHQGGDAINLAHVKLIINGETFDPLCTDTVIFAPRDVITIDKSGYFLLNGDPIKTAKTHNVTFSQGGSHLQVYDIPSGQLIADLKVA